MVRRKTTTPPKPKRRKTPTRDRLPAPWDVTWLGVQELAPILGVSLETAGAWIRQRPHRMIRRVHRAPWGLTLVRVNQVPLEALTRGVSHQRLTCLVARDRDERARQSAKNSGASKSSCPLRWKGEAV